MLTTPAGRHRAPEPRRGTCKGATTPGGRPPRPVPVPVPVITRVDEVQQRPEDVRLDARDAHHVAAALLHAARQQRREVRAAGSQHQAVHGERLRTHLQPHIAEALPGSEPVDLCQQQAGVPVAEGAAAAAAAPAAPHRPGSRHGAG